MRQLTMRMFFCYTAVILQLSESVLSAQTCVIGQNQPAQRTNGGYFVAFPEYGARAYFGGQWTSMTSSGVRYVYCDVGPDSALCQNTAGGDLNFTATQKNAMTTAFSNWTSANQLMDPMFLSPRCPPRCTDINHSPSSSKECSRAQWTPTMLP